MKMLTYPTKCLLCNNSKEYISPQSLVNHIWGTHKVKAAEYAEQFLKESTDVCEYCHKNTEFISITQGYKCRCKQCSEIYAHSKERSEKIKNTRIKNNGVWFTTEAKEQMKKRNLEKYGTEYYFETDEFKEKMKKIRTPEKLKIMVANLEKTMMKKYGVNNISQSEIIKEKKKNTYFKHSNGYYYPAQNPLVKLKNKKNMKMQK